MRWVWLILGVLSIVCVVLWIRAPKKQTEPIPAPTEAPAVQRLGTPPANSDSELSTGGPLSGPITPLGDQPPVVAPVTPPMDGGVPQPQPGEVYQPPPQPPGYEPPPFEYEPPPQIPPQGFPGNADIPPPGDPNMGGEQPQPFTNSPDDIPPPPAPPYEEEYQSPQEEY